MSIELVMPSNHLILCYSLLLLPSIFSSIRVFFKESALHIRWPKYWSFSFSISPSNKYSGLISFRMDWFDLLAVQGTLKILTYSFLFELKFIWHKIHHFKVSYPAALFIHAFIMLCNHYSVVPKHFHHSRKTKTKPHTHEAVTFHFLLPAVPGNHQMSVSMDLPILDISHKWNRTIWDLLFLASFT